MNNDGQVPNEESPKSQGSAQTDRLGDTVWEQMSFVSDGGLPSQTTAMASMDTTFSDIWGSAWEAILDQFEPATYGSHEPVPYIRGENEQQE